MEASPWALYCSVCRKSYGSPFEWLNHLLGQSHQNGAREECQEWTEEDKECVVVAYSSVPISRHNSFEMLEKLSSLKDCTLVTDCILWKERPKVAFIQFESREKVDEVIPCGRAMIEVKLERSRIQLKRATDMIELEWAEFFPDHTTPITNGFDRDVPCLTETNRKRKASSDCDPTPSKSASKKRTLENERCTSTVNTSNSSNSLKVQFLSIKHEVMIPEEEFKKALEVMHSAESIINDGYPNANCELRMFRHWYLKVKNNGTNHLLLFLDTGGVKQFKLKGRNWKDVNMRLSRILLSSGCFEGVQNTGEAYEFGMDLIHSKSQVVFSILTHTYFVLEKQACRLMKYLTKFDPRVIGLITLLNYWTRNNNLCLSVYKKITPFWLKSVKNETPLIGAEPTSLEWMIISFLVSQKIIPSPREILQLPHSTLLFSNEDIGFSEDLDFVKQWIESHNPPEADSDAFISSLLSLASGFFEFYGKVDGSYVLNSKDGELLSTKKLLETTSNVNTKLTTDELNNVVRELEVQITEKHADPKALKILHPIFVRYYVTFDNLRFFSSNFRKVFRDTARRLKLALQANAESNVFDLKAALGCRKSAEKQKANPENRDRDRK